MFSHFICLIFKPSTYFLIIALTIALKWIKQTLLWLTWNLKCDFLPKVNCWASFSKRTNQIRMYHLLPYLGLFLILLVLVTLYMFCQVQHLRVNIPRIMKYCHFFSNATPLTSILSLFAFLNSCSFLFKYHSN